MHSTSKMRVGAPGPCIFEAAESISQRVMPCESTMTSSSSTYEVISVLAYVSYRTLGKGEQIASFLSQCVHRTVAIYDTSGQLPIARHHLACYTVYPLVSCLTVCYYIHSLLSFLVRSTRLSRPRPDITSWLLWPNWKGIRDRRLTRRSSSSLVEKAWRVQVYQSRLDIILLRDLSPLPDI